MKKKKLLAVVGICLVLVLAVAACAKEAPVTPAPVTPAPPEQTWQLKLAQPCPETTIHQFNSINFAEFVNKYTNGRVTITVYPNSELFKVHEAPAGLISEAIHFSASYPMIIADLSPLNGIWNLPMVFDLSYDEWTGFQRFIEGEGGTLCNEALMEEGYFVPGNAFMPTDIGCSIGNNVRPIYSKEDCEGIKIRTPGGGYLNQGLEILGMSPMTISTVEVQTALAQGVIDATYTTPIYQYDANFRPKYIVLDFWVGSQCPMLMSKSFYDSLPADIQEAIVKAAKDCLPLAYAEVDKRGLERLDRMAKEWGTEVNSLSKEEHDRWVQLMQPVFEDYWKSDPRAKQVFDLARAS